MVRSIRTVEINTTLQSAHHASEPKTTRKVAMIAMKFYDSDASFQLELLNKELRAVEGFPLVERSRFIANWTVKELRKFSQKELGTLHHELLWSLTKSVSAKHSKMCRAVIDRTIKVRLENYEKGIKEHDTSKH